MIFKSVGRDIARLEELGVLMRLKMDPTPESKLDIEITQLTRSIIQGLELDKLTNAQELAEKLEDLVQHLLKQEWEKLKQEARKGRLVKNVRV